MPIVIPKDLPAYKILKDENVFVMPQKRANIQDIRPIEIAIVNLMPTKEETETQLIRLLGNSPLQVNITLVTMESYKPKHVAEGYIDKFYVSFKDIKDKKFDGMIITGAPLEKLTYEQIVYWDELKKLFDFSETNITSTIFICWGAIAALDYFYGIKRTDLDEKLFGIYKYHSTSKNELLLKGLDEEFNIPMSRHIHIDEEKVREEKNIKVLAQGDTGMSIMKSKDNKKFFFLGHSEYDLKTLYNEYMRDLNNNLEIKEPYNYFDSNKKIKNKWSATANLMFYNWLNYYVYQITPYDIEKI